MGENLSEGVVVYFICTHGEAAPAVGAKVKARFQLNRVVVFVDIVKFFGYGDLMGVDHG